MKRIVCVLAVCLSLLSALFMGSAWAVKTRVVVRARAMDAKFIGTSIGGGLVVVRDALTREILSKGVLSGSTGNTKILPLRFAGKTSHFKAHVELRDKGAYKFTVYAYDPKTGNTGVDITTVIVK